MKIKTLILGLLLGSSVSVGAISFGRELTETGKLVCESRYPADSRNCRKLIRKLIHEKLQLLNCGNTFCLDEKEELDMLYFVDKYKDALLERRPDCSLSAFRIVSSWNGYDCLFR